MPHKLRIVYPLLMLLAAGGYVWGAARTGVINALIIPVLGLLLIALAMRNRAVTESDATYSIPGELLGKKRLPGQLSFSKSAATWNPSKHSLKHGATKLVMQKINCRRVNIERGVALLDRVITFETAEGKKFEFLVPARPGLNGAIHAFEENAM